MSPVERPEVEAELKRVDDLRQIEALRSKSDDDVCTWAGNSRERLGQVALARGYRGGWVYRRLSEIGGA